MGSLHGRKLCGPRRGHGAIARCGAHIRPSSARLSSASIRIPSPASRRRDARAVPPWRRRVRRIAPRRAASMPLSPSRAVRWFRPVCRSVAVRRRPRSEARLSPDTPPADGRTNRPQRRPRSAPQVRDPPSRAWRL